MTLSAASTRVLYHGPSATAAFPVANGASPIVFNVNSHIKASLRTTAGTIVALVEGSDYTLTGGPSAGVLTLSAGALPTGYTLAIWREQPLASAFNAGAGGVFSSADVNAAFDTARQVDQELDERLDRTLVMSRFLGDVAEIPYAPNTVIGQSATGALTSYDVSILTNGEIDGGGPGAVYSTTVGQELRVSGVGYTFSSSAVMGNPGVGVIRFNNATFASITALAISAQTSDAGNPNVGPYIATWDDSSSAIKGHVLISEVDAAQNFVIAAVGSVANNTTWLQVAVSVVASGGSLLPGAPVTVQFFRAGDAGQSIASVVEFGADPAGGNATATTAAIQAAINFVASLGGGDVVFPAGTYAINATINVTTNDVRLVGAGHGGFHDAVAQHISATTLSWAGVGTGTMLYFRPGGAVVLHGSGITGIYLDCGAGCYIGVDARSCRSGKWDVAGNEFTTALFRTGCATGLAESADWQQNEVWLYGRNQTSSGSTLLMTGLPDGSANTSFNHFYTIASQYNNGWCIWSTDSDNNIYYDMQLYRLPGAVSGGAIYFQAGTVAAPREETIIKSSHGTGDIYIEGTENGATFPSQHINILFIDGANGNSAPIVGTGASCWWGNNQAPNGLRSVTAKTSSSIAYTDAQGLVHQHGISETILGGGSAAITLPIEVTTVNFISGITPTTSTGATFASDCDTTTLNIHNAGASNQFHWHVVGW